MFFCYFKVVRHQTVAEDYVLHHGELLDLVDVHAGSDVEST